MRKLLFFLALTVIHIGAKTIVGSPTVEINSQGVYLVEIKISGDETLVEDDILITNFKSNELLSDIKFDYQIFLSKSSLILHTFYNNLIDLLSHLKSEDFLQIDFYN